MLEAYLHWLEHQGDSDLALIDDIRLGARELRPGMVLSRALYNAEGFLLLSADTVLDDALIERIRGFARRDHRSYNIYIRPLDSDYQAVVPA